MRITFQLIALFVLVAQIATAQEPPSAPVAANPLSENTRGMYDGIQKIVLRSAELMPEENYAFRPVESVRTFGQIVGHIAGSQYYFCATVRGEKSPQRNIEKTVTTKAELIAALQEAFDYCDAAYAQLTDSSPDRVTVMDDAMPELSALAINNVHTIEHYGNLVTYLRMNAIVPPTSDPAFMAALD